MKRVMICAALLVGCGGASKTDARSFGEAAAGSPGSGGDSGAGGSGTVAGGAGAPVAGRPSSGGVSGRGGRPGHAGGQAAGHAGATHDDAGAAGEIGSGGASDGGASGADGGATDAGGTPGEGGAISVGGSGATAGAGGGQPTHCAVPASDACGSGPRQITAYRFESNTYCVKLTLFGATDIWREPRPFLCFGDDPPDMTTRPSETCKILWGDAADVSEGDKMSAAFVESDQQPCFTSISKDLYDAHPGNQFCTCD